MKKLVLLCLCSVLILAFARTCMATSQTEASSKISEAENALASTYGALLEAEKEGANTSSPLVSLNSSAQLLSQAKIQQQLENYTGAFEFANRSINEVEGLIEAAQQLGASARSERSNNLLWTAMFSSVAVCVIMLGSSAIWLYLRRCDSAQASTASVDQKRISLGKFRAFLIVGSLILILMAATPTVTLIVTLPSTNERLSELWLLDAEHATKQYPSNVTTDKVQGPVFVGVGNHMESSEYYLLLVKFGGQTQQLPNRTLATPSPLLPLYEFRFMVANGKTSEASVIFMISNGVVGKNSSYVRGFSVNNVSSSVDCVSDWDPEQEGFYYQMFFELWTYNTILEQFVYHNRFVGLRLNFTSTT